MDWKVGFALLPSNLVPSLPVNAVDVILLALIAASLGYYLASTHFSRQFFSQDERLPDGGTELPPVSIIKPVTKAEAEQVESFVSFIEQDYPCFEVVFSLSRSDHLVVPVLARLRDRFPATSIRWVLVDRNEGPNYKVVNLIGAIREARFDTVVISDSDMRVRPDYLRRIVAAFQGEGVGVVTCLYRGIHIRDLASALHALTIQADFIPNVLLGRRIEGLSYAFGATICTSKGVIERIGGFEPLREYLADDYQIGCLARGKGYEVRLSRYLVDHVSPSGRLADFFSHQLRWAVTQRVSRPWGYFASGITHGVSLATLYLLVSGFSLWATAVFAATLAVRILSFRSINREVAKNAEIARYAWLLPIKDWLGSVIWLISLFLSRVRWKHRRFRVMRGGRMYELNRGSRE